MPKYTKLRRRFAQSVMTTSVSVAVETGKSGTLMPPEVVITANAENVKEQVFWCDS
jgi:hypothetical protein